MDCWWGPWPAVCDTGQGGFKPPPHWPDRTDRTPGHLKNRHQGSEQMDLPSSHPSHSYGYKPSKQVLVTHIRKVLLIFTLLSCQFSNKYQCFVDSYDKIMLIKAALIKEKNVWGKKTVGKNKNPLMRLLCKGGSPGRAQKNANQWGKTHICTTTVLLLTKQTAWSMYAQCRVDK